ncbi:MAG: hypothetical protein IJ761_05605 [Bacteroidales bacterium]|nr:hypothetical protein [Bacteroidales bacterium]
MKRLLLVAACVALLIDSSPAQEKKLKWSGHVNPHYYADSRSVVGGREDMMHFFPQPIVTDSAGNDINDGWQADMVAITARLGLRIQGPTMLGAESGAYIEGGFTGSTNSAINNFRLRHAYFTLDWKHHHLLAGQYWYAMVIHEIMPGTNPLNMGAPFHPYARYTQLRYTYTIGSLEAMAVTQWQLDNTSKGLLDGVATASSTFSRHSLFPETTLQLRYRDERLFVGVAANIKSIQPVVNTQGSAAPQRLHTSYTYSAFGSYTFDGMTLKAQTLLNNSLYEASSLGGYVLLTDIASADWTAYDWTFNTVWFDISRNRGHWRPGFFVGYARNQGVDAQSDATTNAFIFGRGETLDYLWRVQPRLVYTTLQGLSFTAEAEYTRAGYATPVGNLRLSLTMLYAF